MNRENYTKACEIIRKLDSIDNEIFAFEQLKEAANEEMVTKPMIRLEHCGRIKIVNIESEAAKEKYLELLNWLIDTSKNQKLEMEIELELL